MSEFTVADNPEHHRYEVRAEDGSVLGISAYQRDGDVEVFTHTEVDDSLEGEGVGSLLVRGGLDDVRAKGLKVRPLCPFVKAYIDRHPEYADLVVD
jgi:predicted GNAT family acetyltransferase